MNPLDLFFLPVSYTHLFFSICVICGFFSVCPLTVERGMNQRVTEESQPPRPAQRLRLTFSKDGPARFISHLDLARALERALNRAALPVAYTQGFNRRPRCV